MRLLGRFLKDRWKLLCFFAGCAAIFAVVFFLYRLSLEPVLYAALLCMALGLLLGLLLNGLDLWENHAVGLALGPLWGMALAALTAGKPKKRKENDSKL